MSWRRTKVAESQDTTELQERLCVSCRFSFQRKCLENFSLDLILLTLNWHFFTCVGLPPSFFSVSLIFIFFFFLSFRYKTLDGRTQNELERETRTDRHWNQGNQKSFSFLSLRHVLCNLESFSSHSSCDSDKPFLMTLSHSFVTIRDGFNEALVLIAFFPFKESMKQQTKQERMNHIEIRGITGNRSRRCQSICSISILKRETKETNIHIHDFTLKGQSWDELIACKETVCQTHVSLLPSGCESIHKTHIQEERERQSWRKVCMIQVCMPWQLTLGRSL
jgi:hypothetical protein